MADLSLPRTETYMAVDRQPPALWCRDLRVIIGGRPILDGVDIELDAGSSLAVMGPSGSGKTTLLNCIAGLLAVDVGEVRIGSKTMSGASEAKRAAIRLRSVGMVFQFGELLPELTVLQNVALPMRLRGDPDNGCEASKRALERLDLVEFANASPPQLSGGEIQRVAIARAVVGSPKVLLADEPTGALDEDLSRVVCDVLLKTAQDVGAGLLVATHDPLVASAMDRTMRLRGGRLVTP